MHFILKYWWIRTKRGGGGGTDYFTNNDAGISLQESSIETLYQYLEEKARKKFGNLSKFQSDIFSSKEAQVDF